MHARARSTRLLVTIVTVVAIGVVGLTACSSSSAGQPVAAFTPPSSSTQPTPTPAPATTVTATVTASPSAVAPTSSAAASPATTKVNYGQQFLADVEPWNLATAALKSGDTLTSHAAVAAGQQAIAVARRLLNQSWPAADRADVHALAVRFEDLDADITSDNYTKYRSDGATLDADANVVRAELGLAPVK